MVFKRFTCLILALILASAFMPVTGFPALAEETGSDQTPEVIVEDVGAESPLDKDAFDAPEVSAVSAPVDDVVAVLDDVSIGDEETEGANVEQASAETEPEETGGKGVVLETADVALEDLFEADIAPEVFEGEDTAPEDGESVNEAAGTSSEAYEAITATPNYPGVYEVYSTYFNYYPYNMAMANTAGDLYMEYSADGVNWARTGYMRANLIKLLPQQGYKIDGLVPNTIYRTRLFYGGRDSSGNFITGPVAESTAIRTGAATAPAIKSVKLKSVKVKRHKVRHPGYYNYAGGMLFWHKAYTEKYYTCNVKVIVKLKQKPGTNGIWVVFNGQAKYLPGNKKRYTATFTPYPNYFAKKPKRGRYKYTVTVFSGQDPNWGGFSPAWSKARGLR